MALDRRPDRLQVELLEPVAGDRALRVSDRYVLEAPAPAGGFELTDAVRRSRREVL